MAIELSNFNIDNIIFEEPQKKQYNGGSYYRIPIKYIEDGKKMDLCIATNPIMTWGVQENRKTTASNARDGPVECYALPLVVSDDETFNTLDTIFQACRDHLKKKSVHLAIGRFNLAPDTMNPFYYKRDKTTGELVEGNPPTLYPKLLNVYQKIQIQDAPPTIASEFVDVDENPIDPLTLIGCRAKVIAAVTVKDIYIGANPSIQLKVNDAIVLERMAMPSRRLKGFFKNRAVPITTCVLDDLAVASSAVASSAVASSAVASSAVASSAGASYSSEEVVPVKINRVVRRQIPKTDE